ncbi:MAG: carbonic anhydrase [Elusimicrobiota bacterium]
MKREYLHKFWLSAAISLSTFSLLFSNPSHHDLTEDTHSPSSHQTDKKPLVENNLWNSLKEGNVRFISGKPLPREYIKKRIELSKGQKPKFIVLTCADSRLSPELIFDKNLGELFVLRTAGNIADPIVLGSIEYAVEHLGSKMLVILGHEKCGAVAAACDGGTMPTTNLEAIVKKIGAGISELKNRFSGEPLKTLAIRANIYQSSNDIVKNSPIVKEALEKHGLQIVNAIYRLESGEVERMH